MKAKTVWRGKMNFTGECEGNSVALDAKPPFGSGSAMTPKELVAIAAAGCTGMDVVALMKKYKQPLLSLDITVETSVAPNVQPPVFQAMELSFIFNGELDKDKVLEAVKLSQTKFCAVSAMLSKALPIHYSVFLNGVEIGTGEASFEN